MICPLVPWSPLLRHRLKRNFEDKCGEVAEWVKGTGLKNQRVPRGFGGSSPPLSALVFLDPIMRLDLVLREEVWLIKENFLKRPALACCQEGSREYERYRSN
jgi:hypothetical protein